MKNIAYNLLHNLGIRHNEVNAIWDTALTSIKDEKFNPNYDKLLYPAACAMVVGARQE